MKLYLFVFSLVLEITHSPEIFLTYPLRGFLLKVIEFDDIKVCYNLLSFKRKVKVDFHLKFM